MAVLWLVGGYFSKCSNAVIICEPPNKAGIRNDWQMSIKKTKFWETALQIVIAHAHGQFQFAFDITGQIHEFGCFSKVDNWTTHATCVMSLWKPSYSIDGNVVQIHSSQLHNEAILSKTPRATSLTTNTFSWLLAPWNWSDTICRGVEERQTAGFYFLKEAAAAGDSWVAINFLLESLFGFCDSPSL